MLGTFTVSGEMFTCSINFAKSIVFVTWSGFSTVKSAVPVNSNLRAKSSPVKNVLFFNVSSKQNIALALNMKMTNSFCSNRFNEHVSMIS